MALKAFNKIMMIEEKAKKGKRRDRVSVVTGFGGHMGKQHTDSLEDLAH